MPFLVSDVTIQVMIRNIFALLYRKILKPFLFLFDPEFDHTLFIALGEFLGNFAVTKKLINIVYGYHGPDISKTVDGITYKVPLLLSAGFDYNGRLPLIMKDVGFGGEEVGSVTLRKCEGNQKPRLGRALKSKGLIVWKGLKNDGVDAVIQRLKAKAEKVKGEKDFVVGVSIARTNDNQTVTNDAGIADYVGTYRKLIEANVGDYYTINISCPNAFGGEDFANKNHLDKLLAALTTIRDSKPLYVKLPINPSWDEIKELLDACLKYKVQGVVIGNLNKNYDDVDYRDEVPQKYRGGLSGKPCQKLSTELIRKTRDYVGKDFTIFGVGGILSPEDALEKLDAGADLLMLITGMIIEGPHLMSQIGEAISQRKANRV